MLNIREKAVISSAKQKLSRLKIRGDSAADSLSLKKKQRGLLIKLQHEYNEIKFMKNFQKRLLEEKKKVLQQQLRHFKTISGINYLEKISPNNLNFKSSVTVLKERNKKLPIKCYDIALNFKKKSDLFEKRIMLRSLKKTLNDLLSLYFDLQLNSTALFTINQKNTHSQIIAALKEISQKGALNNNNMNDALDYSPSLNNVECIMAENMSNNNDGTVQNSMSITSFLKRTAPCEYVSEHDNPRSISSYLEDSPIFAISEKFENIDVKNLNKSHSFPGKSDLINSEISAQSKDSCDLKVSIKLPLNEAVNNNIDNTQEKHGSSDMSLFYSYDCKKKHCFRMFDKEYVFSNRIHNFQRDSKRKYVVERIGDFSFANLVDFTKFSTFSYMKNNFSHINFQRIFINRDVMSSLKKFHLFTKKFSQLAEHELSYTATNHYFFEENENSLAFQKFFEENGIYVNENSSMIQIKNFSLQNISKIINTMMLFHSNNTLHAESDNLSMEKIKLKYFLIKIKENLNLENMDLECFVYENIPDNIKFNDGEDLQIWEIHDVSFDANLKYSKENEANIIDEMPSTSQIGTVKLNQINDSQIIPQKDVKPVMVSATSNTTSPKCNQLDLSFKDDSYQKIGETQPARKITFGKQFKDLADMSHSKNKNNQETLIETQIFEQNVHSKLKFSKYVLKFHNNPVNKVLFLFHR